MTTSNPSKKKQTVTLDVECYRNYFYVLLKASNGVAYRVRLYKDVLELGSRRALANVLTKHRLITFNGNAYDLHMVWAFIAGYTNHQLKELSDELIVSNLPHWIVMRNHPEVLSKRSDHVDLIGVTPLKASLKTYMARLFAPHLQDLPIEPDALITPDQLPLMEDYCANDVDGTNLLVKELKPQLQLRTEMGFIYGQDFRSMSDPQIAEAVIRGYLQEVGVDVSKREGAVEPFHYQMPDFIQFTTPELQAVKQAVIDAVFSVKESTGHVQLPAELNTVIPFAGAKYKLGVGGLHSQEKKQVVVPTDDELYGEFDVASMYPSIILGQDLYPKHIGEPFTNVYRDIFDRRMAAKHGGDKTTADTLKIVLNSSYGKFGSIYSFLYAPELLIQTTLTGQLALLMLIERMEDAGLPVKSANTDGVNVLIQKKHWQTARAIAHQWTADTGYVLEWTRYEAQYSRDVNSYVAFAGDQIKTKGAYEGASIRKGHAHLVCTNACIAFLRDGTPISETIHSEQDIRQFLIMRGVRGGGVWRDTELGKVVRWYVSTNGEPITYRTNGNKVAGSDGAMPMMTLYEGIPADIDYDWYIATAEKMVRELGVPCGVVPEKKKRAKAEPVDESTLENTWKRYCTA